MDNAALLANVLVEVFWVLVYVFWLLVISHSTWVKHTDLSLHI